MADEIVTNALAAANNARVPEQFGQQTHPDYPEPVILEERIVAPAPNAAQRPAARPAPVAPSPAPAAPATPAAAPTVPAAETPEAPMTVRPPASLAPPVALPPAAAFKPLPNITVPPAQPVAAIAPAPTQPVAGQPRAVLAPSTARAESPSEAVGLWKPGTSVRSAPASAPTSQIPRAMAAPEIPREPILARQVVHDPTTSHDAPERAPAPMPEPTVLREDIVKILQGVKLPERRDLHEDARAAHVIENKPPEVAEKPTPRLQPPHPEASTVHSVHTLKDDLQGVVRDKKMSIVRAAALEQDKRRGQEHFAPSPALVRQKRRTRAILFSAAMLVSVGALALGGVYYIESQRSLAAAPQQTSSLLFAEKAVPVPISGEDARTLRQVFGRSRGAVTGLLGSITRITPTVARTDQSGTTTQAPATLAQFFTALGIAPPDELMRAIGPDFFFGIHILDKNAPVFVIPVTSYDHAFAGMLQWEASMNADLGSIFTPVPALTLGKDGLPVARVFTDDVLRNYDIRKLTDDQGNIEMYYSFPTPSLLVIAESPNSFYEILSRLQAERKL